MTQRVRIRDNDQMRYSSWDRAFSNRWISSFQGEFMNRKANGFVSLVLLLCISGCGEINSSHQNLYGSNIENSQTEFLEGQAICTPNAVVSCNSLAGLWSSGDARCMSSGLAYDVAACIRSGTSNRVSETVYPAQRDSRWSNAKCNKDGDFVFEISYPKKPSGIWQIELQGGGFCIEDGYGISGCSNRDYGLISPSHTSGGDPFDPDRTVVSEAKNSDPVWANAIFVRAHYCSSDLWTGTNVTGAPIHYDGDGSFQNWPFTGHLNIMAMLDILVERYGLNDNNKKLSIHFRGQSAGGWGVINNLSDVKAKFPKIASRGQLMASAWSGYLPLTWDNPVYPVFGLTDAITGPFTALDGFGYGSSVWQSSLYAPCVANNLDAPERCLSGDTMYSYITGPENNGQGGMDIPLLIFQNAQDQVYMEQYNIPKYKDSMSSKGLNARNEFAQDMSSALSIQFSVPNQSGKVKWLYAVNDPQVVNVDGTVEPGVHSPLCYEFNSPSGVESSLDAVTKRFWLTRGQGPGRGLMPGEVLTFDANYVKNNQCL